MKHFRVFSLLLIALLVSMSACKKDDDQPAVDASGLSAAYAKRLGTVLDSTCMALNIKGASVAVLVPNVGLWKKAYGESKAGVPIRTDMALTIGSNTKTYVAALMLKLQELGQLQITDTIGRWIVDKPYVDGQVTIQQLLNHTSGFGDFSYNPEFIAAIQTDFERVWHPSEMYQFFQPPYFTPPGSAFEYSDQNTLLAGLVIEAVTGQPVEQSMRQLILGPAGLVETKYYPFENTTLEIPHSWSADYSADGSLEDLNETYGYSTVAFCSADNAAGGMISTATENAYFWDKLMTGKIISQTSLNLMKTFVDTSNPNYGYGLCLTRNINVYNGTTILSHNGYVPGSVNDNAYDPNTGVCITLLTNQDKHLDLSAITGALHKVTLEFKK